MSKPKGKSLFGPGGLRVVFDPKDSDTPCMVYFREASSTFDCANANGEVDGYELTSRQCAYLAGLEAEADEFYNAYTHNKEGNEP